MSDLAPPGGAVARLCRTVTTMVMAPKAGDQVYGQIQTDDVLTDDSDTSPTKKGADASSEGLLARVDALEDMWSTARAEADGLHDELEAERSRSEELGVELQKARARPREPQPEPEVAPPIAADNSALEARLSTAEADSKTHADTVAQLRAQLKRAAAAVHQQRTRAETAEATILKGREMMGNASRRLKALTVDKSKAEEDAAMWRRRFAQQAEALPVQAPLAMAVDDATVATIDEARQMEELQLQLDAQCDATRAAEGRLKVCLRSVCGRCAWPVGR